LTTFDLGGAAIDPESLTSDVIGEFVAQDDQANPDEQPNPEDPPNPEEPPNPDDEPNPEEPPNPDDEPNPGDPPNPEDPPNPDDDPNNDDPPNIEDQPNPDDQQEDEAVPEADNAEESYVVDVESKEAENVEGLNEEATNGGEDNQEMAGEQKDEVNGETINDQMEEVQDAESGNAVPEDPDSGTIDPPSFVTEVEVHAEDIEESEEAKYKRMRELEIADKILAIGRAALESASGNFFLNFRFDFVFSFLSIRQGQS
jgi:hypothetical protein